MTDLKTVLIASRPLGLLRMMLPYAVIATVLGLSACGGVETCEEPEFYESAASGKRIESPDDLDPLSPQKELVIPEPSPREPRDRSAGCLDRPPTLSTG